MRKALFAVVAALVTLCQFGCDFSWKLVHDIAVHVIGIGDLFNIAPFD